MVAVVLLAPLFGSLLGLFPSLFARFGRLFLLLLVAAGSASTAAEGGQGRETVVLGAFAGGIVIFGDDFHLLSVGTGS